MATATGSTEKLMTGEQKPVELLVLCAVIILLAVGGLYIGFTRGLFGSLDGLLMLAISFMIALIFVLLLYILAKEQGWFGKHTKGGIPPAA